MKISQARFTLQEGWSNLKTITPVTVEPHTVNLVLVFGARHLIANQERFQELKAQFPSAHILINSTSGEIADVQVQDDTIIATAIVFEKTTLEVASQNIAKPEDSFTIGKTLADQLPRQDLCFVFLISDGQLVNGSELMKGFQSALPEHIPVTGGLAGDGARFEQTLVGLNSSPSEGNIAAIGFYGHHLHISHGSKGGWDIFGSQRQITKSKANVLYELDGKNALDLYKLYLGNYVDELPGAALLFPLSIKSSPDAEPVVRTILSIDEEAKTMTFAGDVPEGSYGSFMRANFDKLIDGAAIATQIALDQFTVPEPELAILISCVGRKLVLSQRIEEEVEVAREILGNQVVITGFYSYGEFSPIGNLSRCELHNQTMTITLLKEVE
jgi:hypothetical protein